MTEYSVIGIFGTVFKKRVVYHKPLFKIGIENKLRKSEKPRYFANRKKIIRPGSERVKGTTGTDGLNPVIIHSKSFSP